MEHTHEHAPKESVIKKAARGTWLFLDQSIDGAMEWTSANFEIVRRETDLFVGSALLLVGLFTFRSDKFCDGNTADYLSCTRPTAYHYYGWLQILLIVLGAFFILLWALKKRR